MNERRYVIKPMSAGLAIVDSLLLEYNVFYTQLQIVFIYFIRVLHCIICKPQDLYQRSNEHNSQFIFV